MGGRGRGWERMGEEIWEAVGVWRDREDVPEAGEAQTDTASAHNSSQVIPEFCSRMTEHSQTYMNDTND